METIIKKKLLQEIENSSEELLEDVLNFLLFARNQKRLDQTKPIWQMAQELMADVPQEIITQMPKDGAEQHDHYIYGSQKRTP